MASLTPLEYGTVVWKGVGIGGDTTEDIDTDPDMTGLTGTVTFKASPSAILVPGATPPATALPIPVIADVTAGILMRAGAPGVKLIATDTAVTNPTGFTYTATFDITHDGVRVNYGPITGISVPAGGTVDLTLIAPNPTDGGIPMDQAVSYFVDPEDSGILIITTP